MPVNPTIPVEAELTLFRSKLVGIRRRTMDRYRCALATSGKLHFPGTGDTVTAWVCNLSRGGIGLNLSDTIQAGQEMVIHMKSTDGSTSLKLPARIVHSTPEIDGTWRVGCEFHTPLTADELDALL